MPRRRESGVRVAYSVKYLLFGSVLALAVVMAIGYLRWLDAGSQGSAAISVRQPGNRGTRSSKGAHRTRTRNR